MTAAEEPTIPGAAEEAPSGSVRDRMLYFAALIASSGLLIAAGVTGLVPWPAAFLGVAAIAATKLNTAPWVSLGGGALFAIIVLVVSLSGIGDANYQERLATQTASSNTPQLPAPAVGSLGLRWVEVPEKWNELGQPPMITGGLVRKTESGPYDSFSYRFDNAAVVAGAFARADGSLQALMGSVGLFHENSADFYLHLCFVLHPYSPECIDSYLEHGLAGKQLAEYIGLEHEAEWQLGDQLWKLEISGDVETIRVLSPAAR